MRVALVTSSISHFEVPMLRLISNFPGVELQVFLQREDKEKTRYDTEYGQQIHWGESRIAGTASIGCTSPKEMFRSVRRWHPDVVMVYGYGWRGAPEFILKSRLAGLRLLHRGTLTFHRDPRRRALAALLRRCRGYLLRLFHAHHFGGSYSRRVLQEAGVRDSAMFFVPYSVDSRFFVEQADDPAVQRVAKQLRERLGWDQSAHVVLFICQHNWFKGPDIAMKVLARAHRADPKLRALIVGSGRMTTAMGEMAKRHLASENYHFAGFVPSKETVPYYLASDVVLFTSRYETWGRAINEAMLCQRPCIINQLIPAAGGLVEHRGNGWIVESLEIEAYVQALAECFALSSSEHSRFGARARARALHFSYEQHVDELQASLHYAAQVPVKSTG